MIMTKLCADCQSNNGDLEVRKRRLCRECFIRYVGSKVAKQMESYRFKNLVGDQQPTLLLPVSGGVSSLVLLHALNAQLKRQQEKLNRTAYDILLFHVRIPGSTDEASWLMNLTSQFSSYRCIESENLSAVLTQDLLLNDNLRHLGLNLDDKDDGEKRLSQVWASLKTASAKDDMADILLRRLIVAVAQREGCYGILWGHSDSKLAAKTLAAVAKGRGAAVPNELADGPLPNGLLFTHPLRDLFHSELELYLKSVPEGLSGCVNDEKTSHTPQVSIRQTSIDSLLNTYITSQGEKYPNIMANVVRTASKLQIQSVADKSCALCLASIAKSETTGFLCYGCERMKEDIAV